MSEAKNSWRWDRIIVAVLFSLAISLVALFRLACGQIIIQYESISKQISTSSPPYQALIKINGKNLIVPSWRFIAQNGIWAYVSSDNPLDLNYRPKDLADINVRRGDWLPNKTIRKIAQNDIAQLFKAASGDGIELIVSSAYRTLEDQELIYEQSYGNGLAAPPAYSEHQTGLALDITTFSLGCQMSFSACAINNQTIDWLKNNSYKYGFILRYPETKSDKTRVPYEPWHYRYVGKYLAKFLYSNNLTFDEISIELLSAGKN